MFNALKERSLPLVDWMNIHGCVLNTEENSELIREGLTPEYLYFLLDGTAQVISWQANNPVQLALLHAGSMFGEMSFVEERPPVASVVAGTNCKILQVARKDLKNALNTNPLISRDFFLLVGKKLAAQLIAQNQFIHRWPGNDIEPLRKALVVFSVLSEVDIEWLSNNGQKHSYPKGNLVIVEGTPVPGLLIILAGDAEVSIVKDGHSSVVGSSRRGEFLGEMTLLGASTTATASVMATSDLEILEISKEILLKEFGSNIEFASRFYQSLAVLLSQRLRDQLRSRGMATRAFEAEAMIDDSISLSQMSAISIAGRRFEWLCQNSL